MDPKTQSWKTGILNELCSAGARRRWCDGEWLWVEGSRDESSFLTVVRGHC